MVDKERHLVTLYRRLSGNDKLSLVSFAEFLAQRHPEKDKGTSQTPKLIERSENETVPEALKRLNASYPMLDAAVLLSEASDLMSQYIIQGRPADDVIDDLEMLFKRYYQNYLNGKEE